MFEWTGSLQVPSCTCHTLCSVGISMGINGVTYCLCEHRISPGKKRILNLISGFIRVLVKYVHMTQLLW